MYTKEVKKYATPARAAAAKRIAERNYRHGGAKTSLYRVWHGINNRCYNRNSQDYPRYGGRGIVVEWDSFEEFRSDMGVSYKKALEVHEKTSIERVNVNGNYSKKNCCWATMKEQGQNRRTNRKFSLGKETRTIAGWAEIAGMSRQALRYRLDHGLPIKEAIRLPLNHANKYG